MASIVRKKYTYIDFRTEPGVEAKATVTNAIATGADNQVDYCLVGGKVLLDWIQSGQNDALQPVIRAAAPFGWQMPLDANSGDAIEVGEGGFVTGNAPYKSFTIGTDAAFFIRARICVLSNINTCLTAAVGFRKVIAAADIVSEATLGSAYDDSAYIGVTTNAGVIKTSTHINGAGATLTPLAHAALTVAGTAVTGLDFKVLVSAAGVVTYQIDDAADASAIAFTFNTGEVVQPSLALVSGGTTVSTIVVQEYECGYQ